MSDLEKCIAEIEFRFPCVRDHEFTSKEWQTLKTAVLTQQSNNISMPKLANLIGACDGCKHDLPDGSEWCNECCRNPTLSDSFESPASA